MINRPGSGTGSASPTATSTWAELIAADGYRLLPDYRFDPRTGLWRHAAGPPRARITLADVRYGPDGGRHPAQRVSLNSRPWERPVTCWPVSPPAGDKIPPRV